MHALTAVMIKEKKRLNSKPKISAATITKIVNGKINKMRIHFSPNVREEIMVLTVSAFGFDQVGIRPVVYFDFKIVDGFSHDLEKQFPHGKFGIRIQRSGLRCKLVQRPKARREQLQLDEHCKDDRCRISL